MTRVIFRRLGVAAVLVCLAAAGAATGQSVVPGDPAQRGALTQALSANLAAGPSLETILGQALEEGAEPCEQVKACLSQGAEPARVLAFLLNRAKAEAALAQTCAPCELMKCAVQTGLERVEAANALMSAGAGLEEVRACLSGLGFPEAETYTYSPPGPPAPPGLRWPDFPGQGRGPVKRPPVPSPAQ